MSHFTVLLGELEGDSVCPGHTLTISHYLSIVILGHIQIGITEVEEDWGGGGKGKREDRREGRREGRILRRAVRL